MFYIVDSEYKVVGKVFKDEEVEKMVVKYMKALTKQDEEPVKALNWSVCEDGYYYVKAEINKVQKYALRKYSKVEGYVYNSYVMEPLCCLTICEYNG